MNFPILGGKKGATYFYSEPTLYVIFGGPDAKKNWRQFLRDRAQAASRTVAS